jgi:hypothetical protein
MLAAWPRHTCHPPLLRPPHGRLPPGGALARGAAPGLRVAIVLHYPVHTAAGLVNVGAVGVIGLLCMLSGPAGGLRLHRLLAEEAANADHSSTPSACANRSPARRA